jgi:hypothetical protein
MLLYEMLIAIGIAVVLVVAAIDRLAARVMMGPNEIEPLRVCRRLQLLRRWSHEQADKQQVLA